MVPYNGDPLSELAARLVERHAAELPDLSRVVVLLPHAHAGARLRRLLLAKARSLGQQALLGPHIDTLSRWVERTVPDRRPVLRNELRRELILVEALREHRRLLGAGSAFAMGESLISLFDELTRHQARLPAPGQFEALLRYGYGLAGEQTISALSREATLIEALWRAWHSQHKEEAAADPHAAYIDKLSESLAILPPQLRLYLAGFGEFTPAEQAWLRALFARGQATLFVQGGAASPAAGDDYHPDAVPRRLLAGFAMAQPAGPHTPPGFIDAVFVPLPASTQLAERAAHFRQRHPASPVADRLYRFTADSAEDEARAIDIQIRRWLLAGRREIGVIIEDRRLARRVRALLERAGVNLTDRVGWALSTTSAAAGVERLLETVEEDFHHQPLLDLLKSPFTFSSGERERRLKSVYHLEQDIVLHENIPRGLRRYRAHIDYRQARLRDVLGWSDEDRHALHALLALVEEATLPLQRLMRGRHDAAHLLDALDHALQRLGMHGNLAADAAGRSVLEKLQDMRGALHGRPVRFDWQEFRTWLGRVFERSNFKPDEAGGPVHLLTLEQSALCRFDALIIAGADTRQLPGGDNPSPYFNTSVRRELGIPSSQDRLDQRFFHFRCALECAPEVLFTLHREADADALPSPWLVLLETFHRQAYGQALADNGLAALVRDPRAQVGTVPAAQARPGAAPRASVPAGLLPHEFSATRYQRLIDCPYQFFVADCLGLRAPDLVREALEKSDYGERVHRILEYFHGGRRDGGIKPFADLPGPHDRSHAIDYLSAISRQVFADDLEDNIVHRSWLQRWLDLIPAYIDWQLDHARDWSVQAVEVRATREGPLPGFTLRGRLDRVDRGAAGTSVTDYKTGSLPTQDEVAAGEAVQLPFYALLLPDPPQRVQYLSVDGDKVKAESVLEGETLADLTQANARRLALLAEQIQGGAALPAWGDSKVCAHCAVATICRRQSWDGAPGAAEATHR